MNENSNQLVGVEHLIAILIPQCFQIPLTFRMFPVWDFVVRTFARKALLNMAQSTVFVVSTLGYRRLRSFKIVYHRSKSFFVNFFANKMKKNDLER